MRSKKEAVRPLEYTSMEGKSIIYIIYISILMSLGWIIYTCLLLYPFSQLSISHLFFRNWVRVQELMEGGSLRAFPNCKCF